MTLTVSCSSLLQTCEADIIMVYLV